MRTRPVALVAAGVAVVVLVTAYALTTRDQTTLCGSCAGCGTSVKCTSTSGDSWACINGKCSRLFTHACNDATPCCGNCVREGHEQCDGTGCPSGQHCNNNCTCVLGP